MLPSRTSRFRHSRPFIALSVLVAVAALLVSACDDGDPNSASTPTASPTPTTSTPAATEQASGTVSEDVQWGECPFPVPPGTEIECGVLEVAADREEPGAGSIQLHFALVRSDNPEAAETPAVYLSGGPGQASLAFVPLAFGELYAPLAEGRDLVIFDQRGTGFSEPSLACEEYGSWIRESLDSDLPMEELAAQAKAALDECRQRLLDEGVDFAHYNSAASAADMDELRQALGYEQWDVYGLSYGTRLALTVMRDYPDGIRSVILDSAYPLDADLYEETPGNAAEAIDAFFAACEDDEACNERFPELRQTFGELVEQLNAEPQSITVPDPTTGQRVEGEFTGDALAGFLFQSLYATELVPFLPEIIDSAGAGDFGTIGLLQGAFMQQLDLVSLGMQLAVQCQEEVAFADREAVAAAAAAHPFLSGFFEASPTLGPTVFDLCEEWAAGEPASIEAEAVTSDIPTLVLAGELDPITRPRWGEDVADDLENSYLYGFPFTGHGVLAARECAEAIMVAFFANPGMPPDAACVEDVPTPEFVPAEVDVEMVPHTSEQFGFTGVRPEGWTEVFPDVFQHSPLVALLYQVAPGLTADVLLQQLAAQLGTGQPPQPVEQVEGETLTWDLYDLEDLGQRVGLALAEHEGALYLIQLSSSPGRYDVYHDQVFREAVEALEPAEAGGQPEPGGAQ